MTEAYYERLSALDATFLSFEDENAHMHVGSLSLLEAKPLTLPDGRLDFDRILATMSQMLVRNPRLRQKIWWPDSAPPVWIDDSEFRLGYHFRHSALPLPGSIRQLKRTVGRVMSHTLDMSKPPWEIWVIEGVVGDRFAILAKIHHCLADGITARDILTGYLGTDPNYEPDVTDSWRARPAPSVARIRLDGVKYRAEKSRDLIEGFGRLVGSSNLRDSLLGAAGGVLNTVSSLVGEVSHTPFNRRIGPHRRVDWTSCDFQDVRKIGKASGGKVNDVVLACVTGAVRRFLLGRQLRVDDLDFRVMVPVSTRGDGKDATVGNRVSNMTVALPLFETDPSRRLQRVIEITSRAKASKQSATGDVFARLADFAGLVFPRSVAQRAAQQIGANMVVTNVPGPPFPLYMRQSQMVASYPFVPLATHQALGVALYTYNGVLHWGFQADWEALPDLREFVEAIDAEFKELLDAWVPTDVRAASPAAELSSPPAGVARPPAPEIATAKPRSGEAKRKSNARASRGATAVEPGGAPKTRSQLESAASRSTRSGTSKSRADPSRRRRSGTTTRQTSRTRTSSTAASGARKASTKKARAKRTRRQDLEPSP